MVRKGHSRIDQASTLLVRIWRYGFNREPLEGVRYGAACGSLSPQSGDYISFN